MAVDKNFLLVVTSSEIGMGEADLGAKLTDLVFKVFARSDTRPAKRPRDQPGESSDATGSFDRATPTFESSSSPGWARRAEIAGAAKDPRISAVRVPSPGLFIG